MGLVADTIAACHAWQIEHLAVFKDGILDKHEKWSGY